MQVFFIKYKFVHILILDFFFLDLKGSISPLRQKGQNSYLTTDSGKLWIKAGISIPLATSLQTDKKQLDALVLSKQGKMKTRKIGKETVECLRKLNY